jgi:hypothetical protein
MLKVAEMWTMRDAGHIVLLPFVFKGSVDERVQQKLDDLHREKIAMSNGVIIVTNSDMYIGDSTAGEIDYAVSRGMPLLYEIAPD